MFSGFNMSPPFEMKPAAITHFATGHDGSLSPMPTSTMPSPSSRKFGPRKICKICAEEATSNHFGALSCHACAAFFRRTVAYKRTYTCRHQQKCQLVNVSPRRMCKYCRLARCLAIGMQPSEVRSNGLGSNAAMYSQAMRPPSQDSQASHSDQPSSSNSNSQSPNLITTTSSFTPLNDLPYGVNGDAMSMGNFLDKRREIIFNRASVSLFKENKPAPSGDYRPADNFSLLRSMILESAVCTAFLNSSVLADYLTGKDQRTLLDQALATWVNLDICKFTQLANPADMERIFCVNDQFIDINLQFLERFYKLDRTCRDAGFIAKIQKPFWQRILDLSRLLEGAKLDEYEFAVLAQLTLIRIACDTSESTYETQLALAPYVSSLLKDIHKYYDDNYSPETKESRLNQVVHLVNEMQELRHVYNNHILVLYMAQTKNGHNNNNNNNNCMPAPAPLHIPLVPELEKSAHADLKVNDLTHAMNNWTAAFPTEELLRLAQLSTSAASPLLNSVVSQPAATSFSSPSISIGSPADSGVASVKSLSPLEALYNSLTQAVSANVTMSQAGMV